MGNGGEVARVARIARIGHDRVNGNFRIGDRLTCKLTLSGPWLCNADSPPLLHTFVTLTYPHLLPLLINNKIHLRSTTTMAPSSGHLLVPKAIRIVK